MQPQNEARDLIERCTAQNRALGKLRTDGEDHHQSIGVKWCPCRSTGRAWDEAWGRLRVDDHGFWAAVDATVAP